MRPKGKRGNHRRGGKPPFERRTPPPEATGRETEYLSRRKNERAPVVVELLSGEKVRGVIEYYDRDMIKLTRAGGANFFVPKADIRSISDETD